MLKMALQQFVCGFAVMIILVCKGCHSQQPECGRVVTTGRIVGGQNASPGSWPWQASLKMYGSFTCGGSLITNQWVLTAAHCISSDDVGQTVIHLGLDNLTGPNPNEVNQTLESVVCHPQYDSLTLDNDICLLKLSAPVSFTDYIQPVCLASKDSTFHDGVMSWVTGFGLTSSPGSPAETLQEVDVPIVGKNRCSCYYKDFNKITDNMICAGFQEGGKDSCQGDSGGPLVTKNDHAWVQGGVVSFGQGCALAEKPGIYARVSEYHKWISDTVTGMSPGFVNFTSPGNDMDLFFDCPTQPPSTPPTTTDDSIFGSGENLSHFTYFASLSLLVLSLQVFVSGGM
ncbi:serine protease 27-like [Odontesthes bonariensis]|uniref:serine protease 27-like n=1 Tax=Odontesthes bonariensis TaxID=219752 RepID=UPI003F58CDF3